MAKNTQIVEISNYLITKVDRIGDLMPSNAGITPLRFVRVALLAINDNPRLLQCTRESIYSALLESARLGLEIGGALPQACLVPYGKKAVFQILYRGLIELVTRSGSVREVGVEVVYEGDAFKREMGIDGKWTHIASDAPDREQREITHVYSEFRLADGRIKRYAMTKAEIDAHAERFSPSVMDKEGAWKQHWKAMAMKTVIRQPIMRGLLPIRLRDEEQKYVVRDPVPSTSIRELAGTFGIPENVPEIECDAEGEIMTDEEKAAIEAAEAAAEV